jgi:hypothetical protein
MGLIRQHNLERRLRCVDSRRSGKRAASAVAERSLQLLDAAQELERATGNRVEVLAHGGAVTAIERMGPTLEALATANLMLSLLVRDLPRADPRVPAGDDIAEPPDPTGGEEMDRATRLLFGASQNLRIAAEASKLAAETVRSASPSPANR